jgi:hypothetical protein
MQRLFTTLALIVALVSLVVPSVAVGARGVMAHPSPTYVLTTQGHYVSGPCLLKPGKASSCPRPDLGVLPGAASPRLATCQPLRRHVADRTPAGLVHEPVLRPPRAC